MSENLPYLIGELYKFNRDSLLMSKYDYIVPVSRPFLTKESTIIASVIGYNLNNQSIHKAVIKLGNDYEYLERLANEEEKQKILELENKCKFRRIIPKIEDFVKENFGIKIENQYLEKRTVKETINENELEVTKIENENENHTNEKDKQDKNLSQSYKIECLCHALAKLSLGGFNDLVLLVNQRLQQELTKISM